MAYTLNSINVAWTVQHHGAGAQACLHLDVTISYNDTSRINKAGNHTFTLHESRSGINPNQIYVVDTVLEAAIHGPLKTKVMAMTGLVSTAYDLLVMRTVSSEYPAGS